MSPVPKTNNLLVAARVTMCNRIQGVQKSFQHLLKGSTKTSSLCNHLFLFFEFCTVGYSGSCGEQVVDFMQSMLVFVLPLNAEK